MTVDEPPALLPRWDSLNYLLPWLPEVTVGWSRKGCLPKFSILAPPSCPHYPEGLSGCIYSKLQLPLELSKERAWLTDVIKGGAGNIVRKSQEQSDPGTVSLLDLLDPVSSFSDWACC